MNRFLKKGPSLPISTTPDYEQLKPRKRYGRFTVKQITTVFVGIVCFVLLLFTLTPQDAEKQALSKPSSPVNAAGAAGAAGAAAAAAGAANPLVNAKAVDGAAAKDDPKKAENDASGHSGGAGDAAAAAVAALPDDLDTVVDENDPRPDSVHFYDLMDYRGDQRGVSNKEVVLLLIPLRNCEKVLPLMFRNMMNMTYDHSLIDIAFLVSDCSKGDKTLETLSVYSRAMQQEKLLPILEEREQNGNSHGLFGSNDIYPKYMPENYKNIIQKAFSPPYHEGYTKPFHSIEIYQKDFGQVIGQSFSDRHDVKIQGIRRKLMGRARNWLLSTALKPYHSWVYWRDVDIETSPGDILQFLMKFAHSFDVIVPNVWRPLPTFLGNEQPYDLNSWIESDQGLALAKKLGEDDVIVEGYAEYPTWRAHLAYIRDPNGNPDEIVAMDGVGGVSILAKAQVFRAGANFPAFTFMNHAETEAFGKMSKRMGFQVGGTPHYTIWHIYEPSQDDLKEISRKERQRRRFGKST